MTTFVWDEKWEECELVLAYAKTTVNYGLTHARTLRETMDRADACMLPEWRAKEHLSQLLYSAVEALWLEATL